MSTLTILGIASLVLVILFTWSAYTFTNTDEGTGQTRREAIIEVWISILIGFSINWIMNWILLPMVGAKFTAAENFWLGMIYTLVSVMRGFIVRRWADKHIRQFAAGLAKRLS